MAVEERVWLRRAQPAAWPALHLPGPPLSPHSEDFPPAGAVCELGEAGIPGNPSYSFVNGGWIDKDTQASVNPRPFVKCMAQKGGVSQGKLH